MTPPDHLGETDVTRWVKPQPDWGSGPGHRQPQARGFYFPRDPKLTRRGPRLDKSGTSPFELESKREIVVILHRRPAALRQAASSMVEQVVLRALQRPQWDYRTVAGIAAETGVSEESVRAVLENRPDEVRRVAVPDVQGRVLYTHRSRRPDLTERLAVLRGYLTKTFR